MKNFSIKLRTSILGLFFVVSSILVSITLLVEYNLSKDIALNATKKPFDKLSLDVIDHLNTFTKESNSFINIVENIDSLSFLPKKMNLIIY